MNQGHGHVYPREDGVKARCGGPGLCSQCARDQAEKAKADSDMTAFGTGVVKVDENGIRHVPLWEFFG